MIDYDSEVYLDEEFKNNIDFTVYVGLYQHFNGNYYFVKEIAKNEYGLPYAVYFNVLRPNGGFFTRPCGEFFDLVKDREDNVTGQVHRFERVYSLENPVKNISTQHLIEELRNREDSVLQTLDIEGLANKVFSRDYIVGEPFESTKDTPKGVDTIAVFDDKDTAKRYIIDHPSTRFKVYKRTFIEQDF